MSNEAVFYNTYYKKTLNNFQQNGALKKIFTFYLNKMVSELNQITNLKNSRVLSIGCGNGDFELLLSPFVKEIVAIDTSITGIKFARENKRSNVRFIVASALKLPFKNGEFDVIVSMGVLHHIPSKKQLFKGLRRVLKEKGVIYAIEPNKRGFVHLFGSRCFPKLYFKNFSPDEFPEDPFDLKRRLFTYCFTNCQIKYKDFFYSPFAFLFPKCPSLIYNFLYFINKIFSNMPFLKRHSHIFSLMVY